jgi:L-arabinokinase
MFARTVWNNPQLLGAADGVASKPMTYDAAKAFFDARSTKTGLEGHTVLSSQWAAYVAGVVLVLFREHGVKFTRNKTVKARPRFISRRSPYDPVRVVNAVP